MKLLRKKEPNIQPDKKVLKLVKSKPVIARKLKPKSIEERTNRIGKNKPVIESGQCMFYKEDGTRCNGKAAGGGTLCSIHGGRASAGREILSFSERHPSVFTSVKFDPAYHPIKFLELSKIGKSDVEIAAEFGVCIATLKSWSTDIQEFNVAYEIGRTMYEAYFLHIGTRNLTNDRFNNSLFKYLTMNRLGYSDKIETKSFNTSMHGVLLVPPEMSMEDWESSNIARDAEKQAQVVECSNETPA